MICATRSKSNLAMIQDLPGEHLSRCPDPGRTPLFRESVIMLSRWLQEQNCTDPEVASWIEKYLLFQGTWSFNEISASRKIIQVVKNYSTLIPNTKSRVLVQLIIRGWMVKV
jgi:hypothetical protein